MSISSPGCGDGGYGLLRNPPPPPPRPPMTCRICSQLWPQTTATVFHPAHRFASCSNSHGSTYACNAHMFDAVALGRVLRQTSECSAAGQECSAACQNAQLRVMNAQPCVDVIRCRMGPGGRAPKGGGLCHVGAMCVWRTNPLESGGKSPQTKKAWSSRGDLNYRDRPPISSERVSYSFNVSLETLI